MSIKISKTDDETLFYCQNTNSVKCYFKDWVYSIRNPTFEDQINIDKKLIEFGGDIAKFRSNVKQRSDFSKLNYLFLSTIMLIESLSNSKPHELIELQNKFMIVRNI